MQRFLDPQAGVWDSVISELTVGRKQSHWMWFVFPQLCGLGRSHTARKFAITDLFKAKEYLDHPILGARLRTCTMLVCSQIPPAPLTDIFSPPDNLKFKSSMTLFKLAAMSATDQNLFTQALVQYCDGKCCELTQKSLRQSHQRGIPPASAEVVP